VGGTCWPLASYSGTVPAQNRIFGGPPSPPPPPPPPPPPSDWAAKILARDMLRAKPAFARNAKYREFMKHNASIISG
jgi:hypothetical protein